MRFTVEADKAQVKDALELFEFIGGNSDRAMRVAINKTGPKAKTLVSKKIRSQVRLKAKYVNDRITFSKASNFKLQGKISTPSSGILLSRFATNSNISGSKVSWLKPPPIPKQGIKVKVKPKGASKTMGKEWFLMVLPNSKALAIVRKKPGGATGPQGGKYDVAYGPSVSQVFGNDTREQLFAPIGDELTKQLLDAMRFLLTKKYPEE